MFSIQICCELSWQIYESDLRTIRLYFQLNKWTHLELWKNYERDYQILDVTNTKVLDVGTLNQILHIIHIRVLDAIASLKRLYPLQEPECYYLLRLRHCHERSQLLQEENADANCIICILMDLCMCS